MNPDHLLILDQQYEAHGRVARLGHDTEYYYVHLDTHSLLVTRSVEDALAAFESAVRVVELELDGKAQLAFEAWQIARGQVVTSTRRLLSTEPIDLDQYAELKNEVSALLKAEERAREAFAQAADHNSICFDVGGPPR